jgi:hypothetical protein
MPGRESFRLTIKSISAKFIRISKQDFICILLLLSASTITRLLVILNTPFLYGQDAYRYLGEAKDFAYNGTIQFKERMPFAFFLGVFLKIFGPVFGEIYASRVFMLIASGFMIMVIYFFGLRMAGRLFGVLAALFATFEPYSLQYSTVPYTEVFAISMGLLALHFAISGRRLQFILSPIFFYLAVLTRPELYPALVIPILISYVYKNWKTHSKRDIASLLALFIFAFFVYILPSVAIYLYVQSWGAFGLVQRLALFLKPELLSTTLDSSFRFYDQQILNRVISVSVGLVLGLSLLNIFVHVGFDKKRKKFPIFIQSKGVQSVKYAFFSDSRIAAFCLFLLSIMYIIVLTIFAYGYNWAFYVAPSDMTNVTVLREAVIIIPRLHERHLILLRLLISFPLAYPLVLVTRKVWAEIVHEK